MRTFTNLTHFLGSQPPALGARLARIDVGKGREGLYRDQLPERLTSLAQQTRVASIRASTALEGIEVSDDRAALLALRPGTRVRNRNEQEFAGYRDAIDELMRADQPERLSLPFILHLHRALYGHSGGRGGHLKQEDNAIVRYEHGKRILIFSPPPWQETEFLLDELVARYNDASDRGEAHPLVLLGAFVLDFLAIHPVADGNGRLARLLTTHELLRLEYGVARYASVEQRIFDTKHAYYESLRQSQTGWLEGHHDVWPWISYLAGVLADSYDDFEARMSAARSTAGQSKQQIVRAHVLGLAVGREFRLQDLRAALPGISDPTIRIPLGELKATGDVRVYGTGRGAIWTRTAPD